MVDKLKEKYGISILGISLTIAIFILVKTLSGNVTITISNIKAYFIGTALFILGIIIWKNAKKSLPFEKRSRVLSRKGVYEFVRHPMYAAIIFCFYPSIAFFMKDSNILSSTIVVLVMYYLIIGNEEKYLIYIFREEYLDYMKEVPAFFPKFWKLKFWRKIKDIVIPHEGLKGYIDLTLKK